MVKLLHFKLKRQITKPLVQVIEKIIRGKITQSLMKIVEMVVFILRETGNWRVT
jgi:hypothetical protein